MSKLKKTGKEPPVLRRQTKESGARQLAVKHMKSFRLAADKIRRARKILGTTTDTGTIEAALDMVVFRQELLDGLEAMAGIDLTSPEAMDAMH